MRRTPHEQRLLRSLTPHAQAHAVGLLLAWPNLSLTSARRTPRRNKQVGGSPTSWHLQGRAVDVVGPLWDLQAAADWAWRQRVSHGCTGPEEVLLERSGEPGQHLHVAW